MSAIYKCNWCGEEISKHINSFFETVFVSKKLYNNPNISDFIIKFKIKSIQDDLDICDKCLKEVKIESIKKLK